MEKLKNFERDYKDSKTSCRQGSGDHGERSCTTFAQVTARSGARQLYDVFEKGSILLGCAEY